MHLDANAPTPNPEETPVTPDQNVAVSANCLSQVPGGPDRQSVFTNGDSDFHAENGTRFVSCLENSQSARQNNKETDPQSPTKGQPPQNKSHQYYNGPDHQKIAREILYGEIRAENQDLEQESFLKNIISDQTSPNQFGTPSSKPLPYQGLLARATHSTSLDSNVNAPIQQAPQIPEEVFQISSQHTLATSQQLLERKIAESELIVDESRSVPQILSVQMAHEHEASQLSQDQVGSQSNQSSKNPRAVRSCTKNTPNYSQTHKGFALNLKPSSDLERKSKSPPKRKPSESEDLDGADRPRERTRRSTAEVMNSFQNMCAFDWDLKEINNLKHTPDNELSADVFWFWVNSSYFPYDAQQTADQPFEQFVDPILEKVRGPRDNTCEQTDLPEVVDKLHAFDFFFRFKEVMKNQLSKLEEERRLSSDELESLFESFVSELSVQEKINDKSLKDQFQGFQEKYRKALVQFEAETAVRDTTIYKATDIANYSLDFLGYVDPFFVADIKENLQWYKNNQNEMLMNVIYPSRLEKDFLRHIELWQQDKNDIKYRLILQKFEEQGDDCALIDDQRYTSLSATKRGLVVQEDAQCAVCNNGDYEDEDLIVFCGSCNISVHQKCYGIDELPETDWFCNNCWAFCMKRGLQVRCLLCPKRGGAMKPTSIFTSYDHYMRYHTAAAKKKGLQYLANLQIKHQRSQESLKDDEGPGNGTRMRMQMFEREDKNHALSQIMLRECNFQDALSNEIKQNGETFPQEAIKLHFIQSEMVTEIPEDYSFFLQRNLQRLEKSSIPPTQTLYEWVHLSCAMWIPGPMVTPKTPVRMSKIDHKRFGLQCIICGVKSSGACMQCMYSKCKISFHIECARRANYFMEVEKVDRERFFKVFCEKHRPLKIVKELEERDRQTTDDVCKFSKILDKCVEINERHLTKVLRSQKMTPFPKEVIPHESVKRDSAAERKQQALRFKQLTKMSSEDRRKTAKEEKIRIKREQERLRRLAKEEMNRQTQRNQVTKWREKDKKVLFERVKEKFLQMTRMRINFTYMQPKQQQMQKQNRIQRIEKSKAAAEQKKRSIKMQQKDKESAAALSRKVGAQRQSMRINYTVPQDQSIFKQLRRSQISESERTLMQIGFVDKEDSEKEDQQVESFKSDKVLSAERQRTVSFEQTEDLVGQSVEQTTEQDLTPYYRFGNPIYHQETMWYVTLSKYEFPWREIAFSKFSAKECYMKYASCVQDASTFLKKVLKNKDKYKKMMAPQLNLPPIRLFDAEKEGVDGETEQEEVFCRCKGERKSGYYVACEGEDDCVNNGWLHPECTTDLCHQSHEEIETLVKWFCEDCRAYKNEDRSSKGNEALKSLKQQLEDIDREAQELERLDHSNDDASYSQEMAEEDENLSRKE